MSLQVTQGRAWYMCWWMWKRRRCGEEKEEKRWVRGGRVPLYRTPFVSCPVYMYWRTYLLAGKKNGSYPADLSMQRRCHNNSDNSWRQRLLAWPTPNAPQQQCIHGMWGGIQASKKIKPRSGSHKNTLLHRSVEMALVYMYWRTHLLAGIYPRNQMDFEPSHWSTKCTGNRCHALLTWNISLNPEHYQYWVPARKKKSKPENTSQQILSLSRIRNQMEEK